MYIFNTTHLVRIYISRYYLFFNHQIFFNKNIGVFYLYDKSGIVLYYLNKFNSFLNELINQNK